MIKKAIVGHDTFSSHPFFHNKLEVQISHKIGYYRGLLHIRRGNDESIQSSI